MNTARSVGESASSSTRNAIESESASSACSAGPGWSTGTTAGSGSQPPTYISPRRQVPLRVGDGGSRQPRAGQADEGVLRDVLGVADRTGHPVGDGEQQ